MTIEIIRMISMLKATYKKRQRGASSTYDKSHDHDVFASDHENAAVDVAELFAHVDALGGLVEH